MSFYNVVVHGGGILLPNSQKNEPPVVGFYTSCAVRAASTEEAGRKALVKVADIWREGPYAKVNIGREPLLEVDTVVETHLFRYLKPPKGYTFYSES